MAKFLMLSGAGDGLGLALRLKDEGYEVAVWIKNDKAKLDYSGLLKKVDKWERFLDHSTTIIFDSTGGGRTAERLKAQGFAVFGGSAFADQLEMDRGVAFSFMEQVGIRVPHSETFTDFNSARAYARESSKRLAFKPTGEMGPEVTTYVSYNSEDLCEMLDFFELRVTRTKIEFELQEVIEGGLLISSEGWFNGKRFVTPFNHTFERKQLMNDDLGPSGGCAGNVVFAAEGTNFILDEGIRKMEAILSHNEYIGPIDLNTIVNDEGVWALEFTPRFGYDALPAFLELIDEPAGELIKSFARGTGGDIKLKPGYGGALRVTIPPYPNEKIRAAEGIPIRGLTRSDRPHLYLYNVILNEKNKLVSSKAFGVVGAFTGYGESLEESLKGPYEIASKARIPNKQFRTDLVEVFRSDHEKFLQMTKSKRNEMPSPMEVVKA